MEQHQSFPARSADYHLLMERMANARVSDEQARQIIRSREAHRAFIASLCDGMKYAAGKSQ